MIHNRNASVVESRLENLAADQCRILKSVNMIVAQRIYGARWIFHPASTVALPVETPMGTGRGQDEVEVSELEPAFGLPPTCRASIYPATTAGLSGADIHRSFLWFRRVQRGFPGHKV